MNGYGVATATVIDELINCLGENNVSQDSEKLSTYSRDEVPVSAFGKIHIADVLVFPQNTEQVSEIMKIASKHNIPVTVRGAGTGLSGGAVPAFGGIVLSFEKMNRILELDEANLSVTVEPGVITSEISNLAASHGLLYAGDPCSGDASYIGGNIAENAGGNKVIKYGTTGAQLLAIEAVLPDGSITWFGGKRRKDVTGFDFVHLMAGSEGTLAIITKAVLKLLPLPRYSVDLLAAFPDAESAISFVPKVITQGGIIPASVEFMDSNSLKVVAKFLNTEVPAQDASAALIIQLEDNDADRLDKDYETVGKIMQKHGANQVYVADTRTTKERIWQARKSIGEAIAALYKNYMKEDLVVPTDKVPMLLDAIKAAGDKYNIGYCIYGHAGDGNMHCTLIGGDVPDWHENIVSAQKEIYSQTHAMGGTLSGEHGIGLKRKADIKYFLDEAQIELIKRVKLAFDPQNILNPGKIVEW